MKMFNEKKKEIRLTVNMGSHLNITSFSRDSVSVYVGYRAELPNLVEISPPA